MLYTCTITMDRYNGVYSGGKWTAWPLDEQFVPEEASAGDPECMDFWRVYKKPVGIGNTPDEAYKDLCKKTEK